MNEPTCHSCGAAINPRQFSDMLRAIPETDRERFLRAATVSKARSFSPSGQFVELPDGTRAFVRLGPAEEDPRPR